MSTTNQCDDCDAKLAQLSRELEGNCVSVILDLDSEVSLPLCCPSCQTPAPFAGIISIHACVLQRLSLVAVHRNSRQNLEVNLKLMRNLWFMQLRPFAWPCERVSYVIMFRNCEDGEVLPWMIWHLFH